MSGHQQAVRVKQPVPRSERLERRQARKETFMEALWALIIVLCTVAAVFILIGIEPPRP